MIKTIRYGTENLINSEIDLNCLSRCLKIFVKERLNTSWASRFNKSIVRKEINIVRTTGELNTSIKYINLNSYLIVCTKINFRRVKELNVSFRVCKNLVGNGTVQYIFANFEGFFGGCSRGAQLLLYP